MINLDVHFSSRTDDWATPQSFFDKVKEEFGPFDVDVCATEENSKCLYYFSERMDGLAQDWSIYPALWMNPPYGRTIGEWVKKAYEASTKSCLVVALLPSRTDTKYFHDYIYNKPNVEIRFLKGRLKFGNAKNSAPFPSMLVIFRPGDK